MKNKIKFTLENEFDALIIALISTLLFYGSLWLVFNYFVLLDRNNNTVFPINIISPSFNDVESLMILQ